MDPIEHIMQRAQDNMNTTMLSIESLAPAIADAADLVVHSLVSDGKVLCCGDSGAGLISQFVAGLLLNRYEQERPGLPAVGLNADATALMSIATDNTFNDIFARQIRALGTPGDVLLVVSSGSTSGAILQAIQAAHDRELAVIALCCANCNDIASLLLPEDINLHVSSDHRARALEVQLLISHCLCDLVDQQLFGSEN